MQWGAGRLVRDGQTVGSVGEKRWRGRTNADGPQQVLEDSLYCSRDEVDGCGKEPWTS